MKINLLKALTFFISFTAFSNPAFAIYQYVDCLRSDSMERVIVNVSPDRVSGTFFATTGVNDGDEMRTEVLPLRMVQTSTSMVTFEAQDDQTVFTVEFPADLIHQSSTAFLMTISSRAVSGTYTSSNQFACFAALYDH